MYHVFIANSALMLNLLHGLDDIASSSYPVLIFGERGVGKELVAEQIHLKGINKDFPFVRIKCMNADADILKEKELSEGSTLFFDEISLLTQGQQKHLLGLIQEKRFPRTVRIIASTCKDLESLVEEGAFNKTLFTYLNILPVTVPALRHHADDIEALSLFFLRTCNADMNKHVGGITPVAMSLLKSHFWPGNVRELKNMIEHAVMLNSGNVLNAEDFPLLRQDDSLAEEMLLSKDRTLKTAIDRFKKLYITEILNETRWNKSSAAKILDVQRTYIFRLMKELDISCD
ncbi:MAG: sigma 54-interacting transcriptional regulator [Treponema sp.]|nr:sigma 54-interacting transcriptional regulator [Treponema sp.]